MSPGRSRSTTSSSRRTASRRRGPSPATPWPSPASIARSSAGDPVRPGERLRHADLEADDAGRGSPRATAIARTGSTKRRSWSSPRNGVDLARRADVQERQDAAARTARRRSSRNPANVFAPAEPPSTTVVTPRPRHARSGLDREVRDAGIDVDVEVDEAGHDEQARRVDDVGRAGEARRPARRPRSVRPRSGRRRGRADRSPGR